MCAYAVTDLTSFLRGSWDLTRDIVDEAGQRMGAFTGVGVFTGQVGQLRYDEHGQLRMGEHRAPASRTLYYRPQGPVCCTVWFDDGHYFHDLCLDTGTWRVGHPCRDDQYDGAFEVFGPHSWRQSWYVAGPQKGYSMYTEYTRRTEPDRSARTSR